MNSRVIVLGSIVFCVIVIAISYKIAWDPKVEISEQPEGFDISSRTIQEPPREVPEITNRVPEFDGVLDSIDDIEEGLLDEEVEDLEIEEVKEITDEELSKLWFDIRDDSLGSVEKVLVYDRLVEGIEQLLRAGKDPSIVGRFPALIFDETDYGFSEVQYGYSNGRVSVITMIIPPIEGLDRIVHFISVYSEDGQVFTQPFKIDMVPQYYSLSPNVSDNYIIIAGSKLDSNIYSEHETVVVAGFSIKLNSVELMQVSDNFSIRGSDVSIENNVIFMTYVEGEYSPFVYTDSGEEGVVSNNIFLVTTVSGELEMYEIYEENGLISSKVLDVN